jgi:outer membrane protein OmpU
MGMGELGSLAVHDGSAGPLAAIDNVMPTAYEEADHGMDTGMVLPGAVGNSENIVVYKVDLADGISFGLGYSPQVGSASASDGGTSESTAGKGSGHEMAITATNLGIDGLSAGAGTASITEGSTSAQKDSSEMTYYVKYAWGPMTAGYQVGEVDLEGATTYNATMWGVSFNVNDSISLSYNDAETEYDNASGTDYTSSFEGISAAYNIGPLAIKIADSDGGNVGGSSTSHSDQNTELSISLSF